MKKRLLISVLGSLGIVVAAISAAYAFGTFRANQEGFRQAGEGQAARLTVQVEAGMADANSDLLPDGPPCPTSPCPGGALSFSITNTSDVPLRVTQIQLTLIACGAGFTCPAVTSNKNTDGSFVPLDANGRASSVGSCATFAAFALPTSFDNWPTIGPHSTLQVNGTDNNRLGAGMIHLAPVTPQGCQGALFTVGLNVTATEMTQPDRLTGNP